VHTVPSDERPPFARQRLPKEKGDLSPVRVTLTDDSVVVSFAEFVDLSNKSFEVLNAREIFAWTTLGTLRGDDMMTPATEREVTTYHSSPHSNAAPTRKASAARGGKSMARKRVTECARRDSNPRPLAPEASALSS
jgi:hypothetical protein